MSPGEKLVEFHLEGEEECLWKACMLFVPQKDDILWHEKIGGPRTRYEVLSVEYGFIEPHGPHCCVEHSQEYPIVYVKAEA
jgi:hypothetical protein